MKDKSILKNILIFIGLMLVVSGNVLIQELSNLDEIWIYNFARCIQDGLLPYKDFSLVITPLFPMIGALFLKIFGNEMVVLRFVEIIGSASILFIMYKILLELKINKGISLISVLRNILYV